MGNWPQQACTTMFFLIPKNVTSERPLCADAERAQEVAKWQQKYRMDWDGTLLTGEMEEVSAQSGRS